MGLDNLDSDGIDFVGMDAKIEGVTDAIMEGKTPQVGIHVQDRTDDKKKLALIVSLDDAHQLMEAIPIVLQEIARREDGDGKGKVAGVSVSLARVEAVHDGRGHNRLAVTLKSEKGKQTFILCNVCAENLRDAITDYLNLIKTRLESN